MRMYEYVPYKSQPQPAIRKTSPSAKSPVDMSSVFDQLYEARPDRWRKKIRAYISYVNLKFENTIQYIIQATTEDLLRRNMS